MGEMGESGVDEFARETTRSITATALERAAKAELETLAPLAQQLELADWLAPLQAVLANGNQAQQWLIAHAAGTAVAPLIAAGASAMQQSETELTALLATDGAPALG